MGEDVTGHPLYRSLVSTLIERISCSLCGGEALPSERALAASYGVSRTTVRLALAELERMGLIVRRQGVGTFVAERPETPLRCRGYRFADHMRALGRIPWTRTVSFDRVELDERIAKILGRDPGDAAYRWRLVHEADGAPVLAEEAWLPCVRFGSLSSADVETRELPDLIGAIAPAAVRRVKEELSALAAKREQAHALRVPLGTPLLLRTSTYEDASGAAVAASRSFAACDRFTYPVLLS